MLQLNWLSHDAFGSPYRLYDLTLTTVSTYGVYVIYQAATPFFGPRTIRVGQGDVASRLQRHREDPEVGVHSIFGTLLVAFAEVHPYSVNGVERYLSDWLQPLSGDRFPDVEPIPVNLPLAA